MKRFSPLYLAVCLFAFFCVAQGAQAQGMPTPGPEHQKLAYFVGNWVTDGELKPGPFGPGGKFTITETCDWLDGKFAVLCKSTVDISGVHLTGVSIMSYDSGSQNYVYFDSNSAGQNAYSTGKVDGDTWTWSGESKMNSTAMKTRFTLKQLGPDAATYKFEMANGSDPYALVMEGKQTRQK
jgi:hypothetical protein